MISIEVVFWLAVIMFAVIGFVRMWARELGATIAILAGLLILMRFGEPALRYLNQAAASTLAREALVAPTPSLSRFVVYTLLFAVITFLGYQGETLAMERQVEGLPHMALGGLVGLLNGYLVAGTLWWVLAWQGYPIPGEVFSADLSETAQTMIRFLPPNVLKEPYLVIALLGLLMMRIVK